MQHITHSLHANGDDHRAYHDTGNLVGMSPANKPTDPSKQNRHRGERVGTMMPGIGMQGRALQTSGDADRTSVDPLLAEDGGYCHDDDGNAGIAHAIRIQCRSRTPGDIHAHQDQRSGDRSTSQRLIATVPVRVTGVGRPPRQPNPADHHKVGRNIRPGMDAVSDKSNRAGEYPHKELGEDQYDINQHADQRHANARVKVRLSLARMDVHESYSTPRNHHGQPSTVRSAPIERSCSAIVSERRDTTA